SLSRARPDDARAFSPMAGIDGAFGRSGRGWLTVSGSFKAPEVEQLYDRRPFDLGFGALRISSNVLQPQRCLHWDAGFRTRLATWLWLDGAAYFIRSRDEIGFDLGRFRLAN